MSSDLPEFIAPERLAKEGARLEGRIELRRMARLAKLLNDSQGAVDLKLAFCRSENGFSRITGSYETDLRLTCQRCLEPVTINQAHAINVGITFEGAANQLPGSLEPLLLTQETISLTDFIEEEILLGLPIAPVHEAQDCAAARQAPEPAHAASNPFYVLEKLKSG